MKTIILFFLYIPFLFSQNKIENRFMELPKDIDHKSGVKNILIKTFTFQKKSEKIDTLIVFGKISFSKKDKIKEASFYLKNPNEVFQRLEYDNDGRIVNDIRKNENKYYSSTKKYFYSSNKYPDSINEYNYLNIKSGQYKNYYKNKKLVKQEFFTNDTLREYYTFQYDRKNRLIKECNINTENGFGFILDKSITGSKDKKDLYESDTTFYSYKKSKDTLITVKSSQDSYFKEIKKQFSRKNYNLESYEKYSGNKLRKIEKNITSKDTTTVFTDVYSMGELSNRSKKIITPFKYYYRSKSNDQFSKEVIYITDINIEYDEKGNWIKKEFKENNFVYKIVTRTIEYN